MLILPLDFLADIWKGRRGLQNPRTDTAARNRRKTAHPEQNINEHNQRKDDFQMPAFKNLAEQRRIVAVIYGTRINGEDPSPPLS
jgi:hypothetical protein